jgi:hypothetical protein
MIITRKQSRQPMCGQNSNSAPPNRALVPDQPVMYLTLMCVWKGNYVAVHTSERNECPRKSRELIKGGISLACSGGGVQDAAAGVICESADSELRSPSSRAAISSLRRASRQLSNSLP